MQRLGRSRQRRLQYGTGYGTTEKDTRSVCYVRTVRGKDTFNERNCATAGANPGGDDVCGIQYVLYHQLRSDGAQQEYVGKLDFYLKLEHAQSSKRHTVL